MNLTNDVCYALMSATPKAGAWNDVAVCPFHVQVVDIIRVRLADAQLRHRLVLWDGICACVSLVPPALSELVTSHTIEVGSVITITAYTLLFSPTSRRPVVVILALDASALSVMNASSCLISATPRSVQKRARDGDGVVADDTTSPRRECRVCVETVLRSASSTKSLLKKEWIMNLVIPSVDREKKQTPTDHQMHATFVGLSAIEDHVGTPHISINVRGTVASVRSLRRSVATRHGTDVLRSELVLSDDTGTSVVLTVWGDEQHNAANFSFIAQTGVSVECHNVGVSIYRGAVQLSTRKGTKLSTTQPGIEAAKGVVSGRPLIDYGVSHNLALQSRASAGERYYYLVEIHAAQYHRGGGFSLTLVGALNNVLCTVSSGGCTTPSDWLLANGLDLGDCVMHLPDSNTVVPMHGDFTTACEWYLHSIHQILMTEK